MLMENNYERRKGGDSMVTRRMLSCRDWPGKSTWMHKSNISQSRWDRKSDAVAHAHIVLITIDVSSIHESSGTSSVNSLDTPKRSSPPSASRKSRSAILSMRDPG